MLYALYCAEVVYKAWNAAKELLKKNMLLSIQFKEGCAPSLHCQKRANHVTS
jgi:hypothetical protein